MAHSERGVWRAPVLSDLSAGLKAAAGGINAGNAAAYAQAGADVLVTSSPYVAKPRDVQVRILSARGDASRPMSFNSGTAEATELSPRKQNAKLATRLPALLGAEIKSLDRP